LAIRLTNGAGGAARPGGVSEDAVVTIATTSNLFFDGFESGDHYNWTGTVPLLE
jgi:hypothetical protein